MKTDTLNWVGLLLAGGRYQVKAKLGEGGMGFVYRARHRKLDSDVVIKVPRPALLQDPEFVARFTREIRALVKLEHPHVVKIIDVDDHEGVPFAVMSYLAGGSLEDRQPLGADRRPVPTPPEELGDWLEDVAQALDFVHKKGFVHRDVKPANILFDAQGNVYLSDFGVAKAAAETAKGTADASLTGTGVVLGTPQYMAAEMALGGKYDGRVDQYALAVTVYEMLCGRVPFSGATAAAILLKQTSEQPKPVHLVCDTVPKAVSDAVQKALAKDPAQRYSSCTAFSKAVLSAVAASPNLGRAAGTARQQTSRVPVVSCPACSKTHRLPPTAWGKRVKCPACLHEFQAPKQPSTRTLRCPAEIETGKTPQAQIDTSPHQLPTTKDHPPARAPRASFAALKYLVIAGAVLLLLGLGITAALLRPSALLDDGNAQKRPELYLGYQAMTLAPGDHKYVEITLERNGYEGPIELMVEKLPKRVSYSLPKIAPDRSTTQLELVAASDAEEGEGTARLIARAGDTTLEDTLKVTVVGGAQPPKAYASGPPASVKIMPLGSIAVMRGTTKTVEVRVERQGYDGAIHLELSGADGLIEAAPAVLAAGELSAKLEVRARSDARSDEAEATLTATTSAPGVKDTRTLRLQLLQQPSPRIASVEPIIVSPGDNKTIDVKVDRRGWEGPISLLIEGLPEGVSSKPTFIPAGQDTFHVEVACATSAPEAERETKVLCQAGTATLTAPVRVSVQVLEALHLFTGHTKPVWHVAWRDPQTLVTWSADQTLREWDTAKRLDGKVVKLKDMWTDKFPTPPPRDQASLTPSGQWCAVAAAAQNPNFATGFRHQVQLWETATGREKIRLLGPTGPQKRVTWVAVNDTGRWILCGSQDEYMRLYDATAPTRDPIEYGPAPKGVDYVALVPGPGSGPAGGAPNLPQAPGGAGWQNPVLVGGKYPVAVYGKQGGDIVFWDLDNGKELGTCTGHSGRIHHIAFSPDVSLAASVGSDRGLRVWDLKTLKQVALLQGHVDDVYCVAFSPDGKRLVSGGKDRTLRVWDLASRRELRRYDSKAAVYSAAFAPDGRHIASGAADFVIRLWAAPK